MTQTGDDYLKPKVSRIRYAIIIFASILIMLCSGSVYAWSIFVAPLKAEFGMSTTQTQVIFGLIIGFFTCGLLLTNTLLRRFGPRVSAAFGAVLFTLGYLVASISGGNLGLIVLGMSFLSGIGMAFGYITVLVNLVRWLPQHKGLGAGLAVSGFGGGAIILSQIANPLLHQGWAVMDIFRIVGIVYGSLFLLSSLALTKPPWYKPEPDAIKVDIGEMLRYKNFWILFYVFFAGSFAGLLFTGNLKPLGLSIGISEGVAVLAISLLSIGNASGRIIWGQIHDLLGGKKSVITALSILAVFSLLLLMSSGNNIGFSILVLIVGLSFGSNFVNYASDVANIWGLEKMDIVYPAVSVAYGIAGLTGPIVGGLISDHTGSYYPAIILSAIVCSSGIIVYSFLKPGHRTKTHQ